MIIVIGAFFVLVVNQKEVEKEYFYPNENEVNENKEKNESEIADKEERESEKEISDSDFIQCLANAGVVIYGTKTCPACASLVNSLGGYELVEPIYVECNEERDRCSFEMQTNYIPEIQIKGELYSGSRNPINIGNAVNCEI